MKVRIHGSTGDRGRERLVSNGDMRADLNDRDRSTGMMRKKSGWTTFVRSFLFAFSSLERAETIYYTHRDRY